MRILLAAVLAAAAVAQTTDSVDLENDYLRVLSKWSGYSEEAVRGWRQRLAAYVEVAPLLLISRRANVPPDELISERDRGKTWGDIARDHKVRILGNDLTEESNLFVLAQHYKRTLEEVRAKRRPNMNFLQLNQELKRDSASR